MYSKTRTKARLGCLGCLGQIVLILALGSILVLAMTGVFYPWAFYLGGKFHLNPYWKGWGKMHAKSGDYSLYVRFEPTPRGRRFQRGTNLTGIGYLCNPPGERFRLNLGGSMGKQLKLSTDGEAIFLYMYNWPLLSGPFLTEHRPSLELHGHWQNPNLVMDEGGSISRAFLSDGHLSTGHERNHPYSGETLPITLHDGPYSEFAASCPAVSH